MQGQETASPQQQLLFLFACFGKPGKRAAHEGKWKVLQEGLPSLRNQETEQNISHVMGSPVPCDLTPCIKIGVSLCSRLFQLEGSPHLCHTSQIGTVMPAIWAWACSSNVPCNSNVMEYVRLLVWAPGVTDAPTVQGIIFPGLYRLLSF